MSLEVSLIPLALVVANVIDKDYYESWLKGKNIKKETEYHNIEEIIYDLNVLNYPYERMYDVIRIPSKNGKRAFYFSKIEGVWVLSMSKYEDETILSKFLIDMERISNGKVTSDIPKTSKVNKQTQKVISYNSGVSIPPLPQRKIHVYPTMYKELSILENVLKKLNISYSQEKNGIRFVQNGVECIFEFNDDGQIHLKTLGNISEDDIFCVLQELDVIYKKNVQLQVYDSIVNRLSEKNMTFRETRISEDDSIVITVDLEE